VFHSVVTSVSPIKRSCDSMPTSMSKNNCVIYFVFCSNSKKVVVW